MRHHHDGGRETQARRFRGDPGDLGQLFAAAGGPAVGALTPITIYGILPCIATIASMRHHAASSGWRQARPATKCDPLRAETTDHDGGRSTGDAAAVRRAAG